MYKILMLSFCFVDLLCYDQPNVIFVPVILNIIFLISLAPLLFLYVVSRKAVIVAELRWQLYGTCRNLSDRTRYFLLCLEGQDHVTSKGTIII